MTRTVHAEWTKLRTLPGNAWTAVAAIALTIATTAWTAAAHHCGPRRCETGIDATMLSLSGTYAGQNAVLVLAVLAATGEYATGMIRTTLAAGPRRIPTFAAKAVVVAGAALGTGLLATLGSFATGRAVLVHNGYTRVNGYLPPALADGTTLRAVAGTVAYLVLLALLSLGIGVAVRDSGAAAGILLALLYVTPVVAAVVPDPHVREAFQRYSPLTAGLSIQATTGLDDLPIAPWPGLGLFAAYATLALLAGAATLRLRDA